MTEFRNQIFEQEKKRSWKLLVSSGLCIVMIMKMKKMSWFNRLFFPGMLLSGLNYVFNLQMYDGVLDRILVSDTHYGQEARIL